jgi:hypothetical protein
MKAQMAELYRRLSSALSYLPEQKQDLGDRSFQVFLSPLQDILALG